VNVECNSSSNSNKSGGGGDGKGIGDDNYRNDGENELDKRTMNVN